MWRSCFVENCGAGGGSGILTGATARPTAHVASVAVGPPLSPERMLHQLPWKIECAKPSALCMSCAKPISLSDTRHMTLPANMTLSGLNENIHTPKECVDEPLNLPQVTDFRIFVDFVLKEGRRASPVPRGCSSLRYAPDVVYHSASVSRRNKRARLDYLKGL
ncbi:hypothetical protein NDU88_003651 [Pleurodeles waltl]|uniref:Uncharacterized protein n=1 Tax=Pleurodeles waltl TaxID=8319 RepID=A0AAV7NLA5_PLEWA|nr:hypothetical protein NDU88_003651 [Pleurodeles waltl]